MDVTVTLSANAGVAIQLDSHRIWVDALHTKKQRGFSAVDAALQGRMLASEAFKAPETILYTHCHPDHFSKELTEVAKRIWPDALLFLPETVFEDQITVSGRKSFTLGSLAIQFLPLPHEGSEYKEIAHYGIMLTCKGKNIFLSGDCETASDAVISALGGAKIHLAILDFPWLTLRKGREVLHKKLKPEKVLLCHLPFEQDDCYGYRKSAGMWAEKETNFKAQLLQEPLQSITVSI